MSEELVLAHGESLAGAVALGDYVELRRPGAYRVRLRYHDEDDIDAATDLRGRIVFTSDELVVHVSPLSITLTKRHMDEIRARIRAIDVHQAIPLVSGHWHAGLAFEGEPRGPEDRLFRAGFESLPALFEALDDATLEPERRAWVLGMLWNIVGIENPDDPERAFALGNLTWIGTWPTSREKAHPNFGEFGETSPVEIDPRRQDELAAAWRAWKAMMLVTITP